jgi:hypothetical protein
VHESVFGILVEPDMTGRPRPPALTGAEVGVIELLSAVAEPLVLVAVTLHLTGGFVASTGCVK